MGDSEIGQLDVMGLGCCGKASLGDSGPRNSGLGESAGDSGLGDPELGDRGVGDSDVEERGNFDTGHLGGPDMGLVEDSGMVVLGRPGTG